MAAAKKDGTIIHVPVRPAKVADTTGAGDTLNGAFCTMLAENADLEIALRFANTAASLSTEKFGAQTGMPTAEEVEDELVENKTVENSESDEYKRSCPNCRCVSGDGIPRYEWNGESERREA